MDKKKPQRVQHKQTFATGTVVSRKVIGGIYGYLIRWDKDSSETYETAFTIRAY